MPGQGMPGILGRVKRQIREQLDAGRSEGKSLPPGEVAAFRGKCVARWSGNPCRATNFAECHNRAKPGL